MQTKSQILVSSLIAVIFVGLLAWYANDYLMKAAENPKVEDWPSDPIDRELVERLGATWNVEPLVGIGKKEGLRFWRLPSFQDSYIVEIQLTSPASGIVTVKILAANDWESGISTPQSTYHGAVSKDEIDEVLETFESVRFWRTPPGELGWYCTDGETSIIGINLGGAYRLWANACEPSQSMETLAKPLTRIAQRVSGHEIS